MYIHRNRRLSPTSFAFVPSLPRAVGVFKILEVAGIPAASAEMRLLDAKHPIKLIYIYKTYCSDSSPHPAPPTLTYFLRSSDKPQKVFFVHKQH